VLFGKLKMDYTDMFVIRSQSATRSHSWKLFTRHCRTTARKHVFCERVIAPGTILVLTMRVWVLLLHLNVLLKDPICHHLYIITHRLSTGINMLCYCTNVCNEGIFQRNSLMSYSCIFAFMSIVFLICILLSFFSTVNS